MFSVYDVSGAASDRNCVVLNDIHIDIMDYIVPASCSDTEFRQMWAEFEWENKVAVVTNITDLQEYLQHLVKATNMKCLTPDEARQIIMLRIRHHLCTQLHYLQFLVHAVTCDGVSFETRLCLLNLLGSITWEEINIGLQYLV